MQDLPQRRASTPPSWWPSSELITPDLSKANLIIEESHILLHITDPATWEITLPKEGTITRLYHITLPQHSAHPEETLSPIIETLFNPEFQKRLTNALSIASTIAQARKHATGHHPVIYPSMDILSQSVLAIPVIESAKSTEAHEE
jgi:spermidine/putrescine-binding protein